MREELPALTIWQQIGLIFATPGYDNGAPYLDEGDMNQIAVLLDAYKAERDAERDALRDEVAWLRQALEKQTSEKHAALTEIDRLLNERDALRTQVAELRDAATEFANAMANLTPAWTSAMAQAWKDKCESKQVEIDAKKLQAELDKQAAAQS